MFVTVIHFRPGQIFVGKAKSGGARVGRELTMKNTTAYYTMVLINTVIRLIVKWSQYC